MPKELIVSVNGREKKIAVIEDGRVTEFYIERGEAGQGIVGNIYKGRVMRVLPGMQSAFVDIGLERDAFLYVSDFFDEEEEFERIVVDKTKSEGADPEAAARAAAERIERARIERERQMDTAQERAEPDAEAAQQPDIEDYVTRLDDDEAAESPAAQVVEADAPAATASDATTGAQAGAEEDERGGRGRRGRRRDRGGRSSQDAPSQAGDALPQAAQSADATEAQTFSVEDVSTPFAAGADAFQRVVDEDEAAEEGSMLKEARVQERLLDMTRAVEFDMEATRTAEVGSLLGGGASGGMGFERVDDSDFTDATPQEVRSVQPTVAASVAHLTDEIAGDDAFGATAQSFERVSDDERAAETAQSTETQQSTTSTEAAAPEKSSRGKQRGAGRTASKRASKKAATTAGEQTAEADAAPVEEAATATEDVPKKRSSRSRSTGGTAQAAPAKSAKTAATKSRSRRGKTAGASETAASGEASTGDGAEAGGGDNASLGDAEASVTTRPARGEFARRGGRRRRKPGGKAEGENGVEETSADAQSEEAEVVSEVEEPIADTVAAPAAPTPQQEKPAPRNSSRQPRSAEGRGEGRPPRQSGGESSSGPRRNESESSNARRNDGESRGPRQGDGNGRPPRVENNRAGAEQQPRGNGGGRSEGGGRDAGRGGRGGRYQPTITDLLREGQEIIVQIAKEPISQKGARITSHIALPGRFLVYMPTIEHVGVSRKIESDAERSRLRKLIAAIVKEEEVPSGGFIVRTAGVGISEQDLRDDARYLVRTWRDIRRNSEKQKAPALAHKDLDLVQRILRDQLSDDFTAIRVDSEEEYLAIVEFINRIQPRLVNRVKLYTREEPILDAFGVQPEIEKAIKPRVWLRSGGYLVINQTEALVAIDVNTGKFVGRGGSRLEDTITRTNLEAVDEIARQIRLRDLGGIIVLDLIDMEDRRNRNRVMAALQDALKDDKSPNKVLSFNDFGLVIMTRKRVKQSLERTLCSPCPYCQGSSLVKSPQTVCYEILEEARRLSRAFEGEHIKQTTLRLNPEVARALRSTERDVLTEIEDHLGVVDITSDEHVHQEQFDFAVV